MDLAIRGIGRGFGRPFALPGCTVFSAGAVSLTPLPRYNVTQCPGVSRRELLSEVREWLGSCVTDIH
jgi:hypothetical protein